MAFRWTLAVLLLLSMIVGGTVQSFANGFVTGGETKVAPAHLHHVESKSPKRSDGSPRACINACFAPGLRTVSTGLVLDQAPRTRPLPEPAARLTGIVTTPEPHPPRV